MAMPLVAWKVGKTAVWRVEQKGHSSVLKLADL